MFDIPERNQSPSLGAVQEIENLCFEIRRAKSICSNSCLGVLVAAGVQWRLWPAADPLSSRYILETVSLDTLLQRGTLDRRDRLQLAVQLAKVMMHLHATQWLGERWGKRDIFFPQVTTKAEDDNGKLVTVRKPMTNNPLVRQTFGSLEHPSTGTPGQSEATSTTPCLLRYDRSLFSLGIILIELLIGKRVEDLPEYPEDSYQLDDNAEYQTADRLITSGRVDMEADTIYGSALRRCIRGLDCNATSLEDDGFKHEVQVKVIAELEKFWNTYARKLEAKP